MLGDHKRFSDWLRSRGPTKVSTEMAVTVRGVWAWIYGESYPTPDKAREMVRLSDRYVSLYDIYAPVELRPGGCRCTVR